MTCRHWLAGAALVAGLATTPAAAHVTLDRAEAPADSYVRLAIRVSHGCAGAATTGIRLLVPGGLAAVRPAPKPGWTLSIVPGEPPARGTEIVWRGGPLPDNQFDEFLLMVRTPMRPGETLWFPFIQECEGGVTARWTEQPQDGHDRAARPAWALRMVPKPDG